jgi:hypothetical protein
LVEGHTHHTADESGSRSAHSFDFLGFLFESESTGFACAAIEPHHALVKAASRLWRESPGNLSDRFVADEARIVLDGH